MYEDEALRIEVHEKTRGMLTRSLDSARADLRRLGQHERKMDLFQ